MKVTLQGYMDPDYGVLCSFRTAFRSSVPSYNQFPSIIGKDIHFAMPCCSSRFKIDLYRGIDEHNQRPERRHNGEHGDGFRSPNGRSQSGLWLRRVSHMKAGLYRDIAELNQRME
jgi:hypothetical protein